MWLALKQLLMKLGLRKVPTLKERRQRVREETYARQNLGKAVESRRWQPIPEGFQRQVMIKDKNGHHDFHLFHITFHPNTADIREFGHTPWVEEVHGRKTKAPPKPTQPIVDPIDPFDL